MAKWAGEGKDDRAVYIFHEHNEEADAWVSKGAGGSKEEREDRPDGLRMDRCNRNVCVGSGRQRQVWRQLVDKKCSHVLSGETASTKKRTSVFLGIF